MQWWNNPVIQSAVIPLVITVLLLVPLSRLLPRLSALAVMAGFYSTALLVNGPTLTPLTSTRKILIVGVLLALLALLRQFVTLRPRWQAGAVVAVAVAALLWVLWPLLSRKTGMEPWVLGGGLALYIAWLVVACDSLAAQPLRAGIALMMMGVAGGIASTLAATALLGQLISALAAASGAFLLLALLLPGLPAGPLLTTPVTVVLGLLTCAASVYARLPLSSLVYLATVPLLIRIPLRQEWPAWIRAVMLGLYVLPAVGMTIYSAWKSAGAIPF